MLYRFTLTLGFTNTLPCAYYFHCQPNYLAICFGHTYCLRRMDRYPRRGIP